MNANIAVLSLLVSVLMIILASLCPPAPAEVYMIRDIYPGSNSGFPDYLTDVNGTLFFNANDGVNSGELWKSDGAESGTVMVKDNNPTGTSNPFNLTNANGTLFF